MANDNEHKIFDLNKVIQIKVTQKSDLLLALYESLKRAKVTSGVILGGVGALEKCVFRNLKVYPTQFPITDEERLFLSVEKPLELISLTGWVGEKPNGEPEVHAHFSASFVENNVVKTYGGHLTEGTIASIKVAVTIGVFEEKQKVSKNNKHGQWDLDLV